MTRVPPHAVSLCPLTTFRVDFWSPPVHPNDIQPPRYTPLCLQYKDWFVEQNSPSSSSCAFSGLPFSALGARMLSDLQGTHGLGSLLQPKRGEVRHWHRTALQVVESWLSHSRRDVFCLGEYQKSYRITSRRRILNGDVMSGRSLARSIYVPFLGRAWNMVGICWNHRNHSATSIVRRHSVRYISDPWRHKRPSINCT